MLFYYDVHDDKFNIPVRNNLSERNIFCCLKSDKAIRKEVQNEYGEPDLYLTSSDLSPLQ